VPLKYCRRHDILLCARHLAGGCLDPACEPRDFTPENFPSALYADGSCSVCCGVFRQDAGTLSPEVKVL
jgi:hypothetical protein